MTYITSLNMYWVKAIRSQNFADSLIDARIWQHRLERDMLGFARACCSSIFVAGSLRAILGMVCCSIMAS